jgi:hypothetical protein
MLKITVSRRFCKACLLDTLFVGLDLPAPWLSSYSVWCISFQLYCLNGAAFSSLQCRFGNVELAEKLVPRQPADEEAHARAQLLLSTVSSRLPVSPTTSSSSSSSSSSITDGSSSNPSSSSSSADQQQLQQLLKGSGPFGLLTPGDVQQLVYTVQSGVGQVWPQLQQLAQQPGAAELAKDVSNALVQRFAARAIKFAFGVQDARQVMAATAAARDPNFI